MAFYSVRRTCLDLGGRSVFVCGGGLGTKRKLKPETFTGPEQRGQISTPSDLASRHLTFGRLLNLLL